MRRPGVRGWASVLLLALVWSSTCVGADARDPWYRRGRRERPGIPLWKPPTSSSDEDPVVVEVTGSAPQDAAPAPRIDAIEAIENVDLEAPGALEKALAARARASDKELMVLAVGDTRDHRRMHKDPALSQVSVDFAINLVENLAALGLRNYLMLTSSAQLCDELRRDADVDGCAHSSHLTDRETELERWGLKPGDMFLLWAQQWRVVQRALEGGYSVMRVDSDVVFLEDPYLALRGPLLSPFAMISQTDVFDLGTRPRCDPNSGVVETPGHSDVKRCVSSSVKGQPQLNIGLVYFRRSAMADDGPTLGAIKDMLAAFTARLLGDVQVNDDGDPISEALLDQPLFREAVSQRVRLGGGWKVASGHGGEVYARGGDGEAAGSSRKQPEAPGDECPHARATCDAIAAERRRTDIAFAALGKEGSELVAGAPDWLFGRGCVKTVADAPLALAHLRSIRSTNAPPSFDGSGANGNGTCETRAGVVNRAPGVGGVGGGVVAVHMVYSKARKRVDAMEAMGWWRARIRRPGGRGDGEGGGESAGDGSAGEGERCVGRRGAGALFSHTYFRQNPPGARAFVCAGGTPTGTCPCCEPVPDEDGEDRSWVRNVARGVGLVALDPEDREDALTGEKLEDHIATAPGCGMHQNGGWNEFWDR